MANATTPELVVVVAPDSFKGSLSAPEASVAITVGLRRACGDAEIRCVPMADGGEGTLDVVLAAARERGSRRVQTVTSAAGTPIDAGYGILDLEEGRTAVLEVAQVVGMAAPTSTPVRVEDRSTLGVGQLLRTLLDQGLRRFVVGLGGSNTNDAGAGMLCALGARLIGANGAELAPRPSALAELERVEISELDRRLVACSLTILADVENPLCGPHGATATFGPQKGVAAGDVGSLGRVLERFAAHAQSAFGRSAATQRGAGAAGGLGFAFQLLGATCVSGAEAVAELVQLDAALAGADWSISGEGRSDEQTLAGKAPLVVARRARGAGVPITLLSAAIDGAALPELCRFFDGCFAISPGPISFDESVATTEQLLADRAEQLARLWIAARGDSRLSANERVKPGAGPAVPSTPRAEKTSAGRRTRSRRA